MKNIYASFCFLLLVFTFLTGCGSTQDTESASNKDTLTIYTTVFPLEDFTKKIGGKYVDVTSIYPPGVDAHSFEPTAKTMVDIANSDALIYTGIGIEGFMEASSDSLEKEQVKIIKVAEGLAEESHEEEEHHEEDHESHEEHDHEHESSHEDGHDHGDHDPHVWLDPVLSIKIADSIYHALAELKPEGEAEFKANYTKLKAELEKLDQDFKETIEHSAKKEILVSHAAYGYWESRYGIEQISVTGLSPTNEPTQKDLQEIIETAKKHQIKYVIIEQNLSTKMSDTVKKEINADTLILRNLESITEQDAENGEDYFSLMRKNLETLKTALN